MKVAQLCTRYPPGPGGVERHVAEVATRLGARGHTVEVYTSDLYREFPMQRLPPDVPREERVPFGTVHRLRAWSLPGELHYPFFRGLENALQRDRPDIVHTHTYGTNQVAVARRHRTRTGTPFVLTAHFHPIWSIYGGWLRHRIRGFYDRRLAGPVVAAASRVIVQTHEEERLLRTLGLRLPPVEILPPGYSPLPSPPDGAPSFRDRMGIPGPYVLFVGRLASNKGLVDLLPAFGALARDDPDAHLVLVGEDGGMRATLEARVRGLGLESKVHFLGHLPDDALVAAAYRDATFSVLPSEYEAFGLVLLESLAQGTPVVASRVGGIPEFIEDERTGLLVPPGDLPALTEALRRLWGDPALARRLGRHGRTEVVPRYTWDRVVDRLEVVYREVLGH
ncbi:MAG: glycosyltransferase family 4 protein [Thermoplasmata archaeon]|nr:glycosyltransferase family 4 protein [Thermoplasmata archaeon]